MVKARRSFLPRLMGLLVLVLLSSGGLGLVGMGSTPLTQAGANATGASLSKPASLVCLPTWNYLLDLPSYNFQDVANLAPNDAWAVGDHSNATAVEHWNGTQWGLVYSPAVGSGSYLMGVSANSPNDIWAVGRYLSNSRYYTLIEHWNGTQWSVLPSPNVGTGDNYLQDVAAVSANDVWAVGAYGATTPQALIMHWDGGQWSIIPNPAPSDSQLDSIAAISANDIWAVGFQRVGGILQMLIERWDGAQWSMVSTPQTGVATRLHSVAASAANDVWAVGEYPGLNPNYRTLTVHWDGTQWTTVPSPNPAGGGSRLVDVTALAPDDAWAVGEYLYPTAGVGARSLIEHWDGSTWDIIPSSNIGQPNNYLSGASSTSASDMWLVGNTFAADYYSRNTHALALRNGACATSTPTHTATFTYTPAFTQTPTGTSTSYMPALHGGWASHYLSPEDGAPTNGGSVLVGSRFVLDLNINSGIRSDLVAQQAYLTFTNSVLQNARVDQIATSCVPTNSLTIDDATFEAILQNEVCNGPGTCNFHGNYTNPGSIGFASGSLSNCSEGCGGTFRLARVGLCAVGLGTATLHWQFTPPAPFSRDTQIVSYDGSIVNDRTAYEDYVVNVVPVPTSVRPPCWVTLTSMSTGCTSPSVYNYTLQFDSGERGANLSMFVHFEVASAPGGPWVELDLQQFSLPVWFGHNTHNGTFTENNIPPRYNWYRIWFYTWFWCIPLQRDEYGQTEPAYICSLSPNTATATPTFTPVGIINGHLTWQGISQPDAHNQGLTATLTLCSSGLPAFSGVVTTDQSGNFAAVTGLANGSYSWIIKGRKHLSNSGTITLGSGGSYEFDVQRAGDCDNSNLATILDFNIIKVTFGKSLGQPGYDERADFDNDNTANIVDFNLLKTQYGQDGASLTCPPSP